MDMNYGVRFFQPTSAFVGSSSKEHIARIQELIEQYKDGWIVPWVEERTDLRAEDVWKEAA